MNLDSPENKDRLNQLHRQLLEILKGNLWHQIERSKKEDEMEALLMLVNSTAEEFRDNIQHEGFINFHDSYEYTIQMLIMLDTQFLVTSINDGARQLLGYEDTKLLNKPFERLLTPGSKQEWSHIKKDIVSLSWKEKPVTLDIRTQNGLLYPAYCYIVPFSYPGILGRGIAITAFEMATTSQIMEKRVQEKIRTAGSHPKNAVRNKNILRPYDIEVIRSIADHLRKHLKDPTPSTGDLAFIYGINEFKLKYGFKELFGTTIFQYLKEERLKKSHVLVELTNYNFMDIATMVGFRSATHFSREFNARFGYRPRALRSATHES